MEIAENFVPHAVRIYMDDLLRRGYAIVDSQYDEAHFGDVMTVLQCDSTRVRFVRDRGQWFVDVAAGDDWFSPIIWRAYLDASTPPLEVVSFGAQTRWVLDHLGAIESINRNLTQSQLASLREWRLHRARAWGLPIAD